MNRWVKWSQWTGEGMVNFGQMPVRDIAKYLQVFEMDVASKRGVVVFALHKRK